MRKKYFIVFLGSQGSGKGTQASKLSEELNIPHISTGNIFRYHLKNQTELGVEVGKYINQGLLAPDEVVNKIIADRLSASDSVNGFVLDGYPRNIFQAEFLDKLVEVNYVLEVYISDEEAIRRLAGRRVCQCGATYHLEHNKSKIENICDYCGRDLFIRDDDQPAAIKKRLAIYHEETEPLINYYQQKSRLFRINGEQMIMEVHEEIIGVLGIHRREN